MGFNIQAAQKAGYSPQEIDNYISSQRTPSQKISDAARISNFGVLPNILANAVDIGKGAVSMASGQGKPSISSPDYNNPFRTQTEAQQALNTNPVISGLKDTAALGSWLFPETKIATLPRIANLALHGAEIGGLSAASQQDSTPQSVAGGAVTGAIANPALAGAGNLLTDKLPRYIGLRNFGEVGKKLPEVVKAEQAAGDQTLKDVRSAVVQNTSGKTVDKSILLNSLRDLANQPSWVGTPGLSELTRTSGKAMSKQTGILPDLIKTIQNSPDLFTAYNSVKNMAYPSNDSQAANRLASFTRSAAHLVREHLINTSDNPAATRNAMDTYAAQTAMNMGKKTGGNNVGEALANMTRGGGGELLGAGGLGMIAGAIPAVAPFLGPAAGLAAIDTALTNKYTGPTVAKGLVKLGEKTGTGALLKRLGVQGAVSGVQGIANGASQ